MSPGYRTRPCCNPGQTECGGKLAVADEWLCPMRILRMRPFDRGRSLLGRVVVGASRFLARGCKYLH
jgi:hypothetical protein